MHFLSLGLVALVGLASASPVDPSNGGEALSKRQFNLFDGLMKPKSEAPKLSMSDRCREEAGMQANFCDTNYAQVPDWNYKFMNCYVAMMKPAQRVCVGPDAKHLRSPQLAYPCPRTFGTARYYAYMGWLPGMPRRGSFGRKWDSNDHARCVDMASGRGRS